VNFLKGNFPLSENVLISIYIFLQNTVWWSFLWYCFLSLIQSLMGLNHNPSPFSFHRFSDKLLCFVLFCFGLVWFGFAWADLDYNPPTYASCVAGITGVNHHPQLVLLIRKSHLLFPRLSWNCGPPNLNSWVSGITGVSHSVQLQYEILDWHFFFFFSLSI
jgi:hypothetical protein